MSQITHPSKAAYLPIGRRIGEIMEEKGGAFSQRSFAPRVGLSKDTLGRIILGERHAKPSELQRIAEGLSLSVSRLKQEDSWTVIIELEALLERKKDLDTALLLADKLMNVAVGITERCDAALLYARTIYALGDYDEAHRCLLESYRYAEKIYEKYGETERLYNVLSKLLITFSVRKEFSRLSEILGRIELVFDSNPEKMSSICYSKAMIAEQFGNVEEVRKNLYRALELCELTKKENDIGRAQHNVGYFEFKQQNYELAKYYLFNAISKFRDDTYHQLIVIKEYVKTLIKLDELPSAVGWLEKSLTTVEKYPHLRAKYYLLLAIAKGEPSYADAVFHIPNVEKKVMRLVCKYLMKHYIKLGDSDAVLKYSMIAERYEINHSDIIDEEDL